MMNYDKLSTLPHIADLKIEEVVADVGLYSPILIDVSSTNKKYSSDKVFLTISNDVKALYSLVQYTEPHLLFCSECQRELPHVKHDSSSQSTYDDTSGPRFGASTNPDHYYIYRDVLLILNEGSEKNNSKVFERCKKVILSHLSSFSLVLSCTFNSNHLTQIFFEIEDCIPDPVKVKIAEDFQRKSINAMLDDKDEPEPTIEERDALDYVEMCKNTLILKKIGQYPSLADVQFQELSKYRKLLKDQYKELTRAVGLFASGIGIGAFVYLRRIFENLCEEAHKRCVALPGWNESLYKSLHFNEQIECLEQSGEYIFPDELSPIRNKLYGVISKGIHKYSESECQEMFPHVLMAIELILDKKLNELERSEKIKKMTFAIANART